MTGLRRASKDQGSGDRRVIGGAERLVFDLICSFNSQKFESIIIYDSGGRLNHKITKSGIKLFHMDTQKRVDLKNIWRILQIIRNERIDILHTHSLMSDFCGSIIARISGISHIITRHVAISHHNLVLDKKRIQFFLFIDRFAAKFVSKIVSVSKLIRKDLIECERVEPSKVVTIRNAVDILYNEDKIDSSNIRKEFAIGRQKIVVGMIAQLSFWKGNRYFLEAARVVIESHSDVIFMVIGEGPDRQMLEAYVHEIGISGEVIFTGFRENVGSLINLLDISVLSSLREGLPLSLLESMMFKKPIVATNVGAVCELIVDGVTGFLVPPKDVKSLAFAINTLVTDRNLAKKMGIAGYKRVKTLFRFEDMVRAYEDLYCEISRG